MKQIMFICLLDKATKEQKVLLKKLDAKLWKFLGVRLKKIGTEEKHVSVFIRFKVGKKAKIEKMKTPLGIICEPFGKHLYLVPKKHRKTVKCNSLYSR